MEKHISAVDIGTIGIMTDDPSVSYYQSISPTLRLNFRVTASGEALVINDVKADIYIINDSGSSGHVGRAILEEPFIELHPGTTGRLILRLELDHYKLRQIEKLREGKNLVLRLDGKFLVEKLGQPNRRAVGHLNDFQMKVPKSDWVEQNLPYMGFKDISLIELPKLTQEWEDITEHLNEAWRQHSMGKYDNVLTECRKALEALSGAVKKNGFTVEDEKMPDWNGLLGNKKLGSLLRTINQKMHGFLALGAHTGKAINREDSDFALLVTNGIVILVTEKLLKTSEQ